MTILKQSTAVTIKLGPFVDDADGKTAETSLTISQADIRLSKNGGDIAQSHNATGATHDELGYYNVPLDATDTDTLGRLRVLVSESGALPVWQDFIVVTANVFDSLFSTDKLDVAVVEMADDVITAGKFDESTAFPVKSADTGATQIARVGADSDTLETLSDEIAAVKAETAAIVEDTGTTLDTLVKDIPTNSELATALGTADDAVLAAVAAARVVIDNIHDTDLPAVKAETSGIKGKTDNLPTDPADESALEALIAGLDTKLDTIDNFLDTEVAAILEDTGTTLPATLASILEDTGTTIPATLATVAKTGADGDTLETLSDQLDSITSGSNTVEYPVTNNLGAAVQGAFVYVTTDAGGSNIIRSGYTNSAGKVTFNLDHGTYYFWTFHKDTLFNNPDMEVIA